MSSSLVDKENTNGLFHSHTSGTRKFGDQVGSNLKKTSQYSTPQHKLKTTHKLKENIGSIKTEKRRALGDLLNTTSNRQSLGLSATPKGNSQCPKLGTPLKKSIKKLTNDFEKQSSIAKNELIEQENYPPVEKCIPQTDSFNDLFEDGKLSDIFLNKKMKYIPRLPSCNGRIDESGERISFDFNVYNDRKLEKELKQMNKSIRNQCKKENADCLGILQELPSLELPQILEDLDLSI